jgi:hypothetical protein
VSQFPPVAVVADACHVVPGAIDDAKVNTCVAGDVPAFAVKASDVGVTEIPVVATVKVTVNEALSAPAVTSTCPTYVPTSVPTFAETTIVPLPTPVDGVIVSQFPPVVVTAAAVQFGCVGSTVTLTTWVGGFAIVAVALNVNDVGDTASVCSVAVSVTGTTSAAIGAFENATTTAPL